MGFRPYKFLLLNIRFLIFPSLLRDIPSLVTCIPLRLYLRAPLINIPLSFQQPNLPVSFNLSLSFFDLFHFIWIYNHHYVHQQIEHTEICTSLPILWKSKNEKFSTIKTWNNTSIVALKDVLLPPPGHSAVSGADNILFVRLNEFATPTLLSKNFWDDLFLYHINLF